MKTYHNPALLLAAILTLTWPEGDAGPSTTQEPATNMSTCTQAGESALRGIGLPLGRSHPALSARCSPAEAPVAGFAPGWDCIRGFNCQKDQGDVIPH